MNKILYKLIYTIPNIPLRLFLISMLNPRKKHYTCPICTYQGPFPDAYPIMGMRKDVLCPVCLSFERHRLQYLSFVKVVKDESVVRKKNVLHFAPEPCIKSYFQKKAHQYVTSDLHMKYVDCKADITSIPFQNDTFDIIWASHILEHVKEDMKALQELSRVVKTDGIALLPIPIISNVTVEYKTAKKEESDHVRRPGLDYIDKYKNFFRKTKMFSSDDFNEKYRLSIISKDKNGIWTTEKDYVPICIK